MITLLAIPRLSKQLPELDIDSITGSRKSPDKEYIPIIKSFREFVKSKFNKRIDDGSTLTRSFTYIPRMRMTQGPNSEVTLASSVMEAKAIIEDKTLVKSLSNFLTLTGGEDLLSYIKSLASTSNTNKSVEDVRLGRLTQVPDSLNKNRVVAMVDYWTNITLAPLEELVRNILKRHFHETDFLRNHSLGSEKVKDHKGKS
jgi:hypothetical protein